MPNLTLSILDIILLVFFAIVLGITIHFFITSRRNLKSTFTEPKKNEQDLNEWKMKYFNDVEIKDKELSSLRQQLEEAEENSKIYLIEAEESKNRIRNYNRNWKRPGKPHLSYLPDLMLIRSIIMSNSGRHKTALSSTMKRSTNC